ncbi:MAG: ribosomal protein S18-alanine N-acetyltransferase [Nitrospirae bacterium]|nr:ribosomal protein S18-alanine N-acetyltransferase [Candidatus Troglogloeales bacterium]MBI3598414.1 ribosomal protein S18-alanine N-acetyltransferase [Candidatus Troglogloeales bacterium]
MNVVSCQIMKMEITDLDDVMAIEQIAFSAPWTKEMFYSEFFDNSLSFSFVAKEGDDVVGYLFAWEVSEEFHLMNIAVAPKWQRQGIGEALIKKMCDVGTDRSIKQIQLEVRASNTSAISFYGKLRFYKVGIRKNYYRSPHEDALILQYDFPL